MELHLIPPLNMFLSEKVRDMIGRTVFAALVLQD